MNTPNTALSVLVAGGGTAGHVEPALAVAEALRDKYGASVTALGTARGLETSLVPDRGFPLRLIEPVPVPRKPSLELLKLPFRVITSIRQTRQILTDTGAQAVAGFGGYVSAPAYLAARSLGLPFFVHEANARAGMANKLGVKLGGTGLNAVADSGMPGDVVGIPIRQGLGGDRDASAAARARSQWNLDEDRTTIFVTGGSQGAASLNDALAGSLDELLKDGYQILHAVGKRNDLPEEQPGYVPLHFIEDMQAAYTVADLIICRSGAMTVAEVTASGIPAIYVPLPHGNGEQALNARTVIEAGAARLVDDSDLTPERFVSEVRDLLQNTATYDAMAQAARLSTVGNAAAVVADLIAAAVTAQPQK